MRLPTGRASTIVMIAIGTSSSADLVGLSPRTTWAHSRSGIANAVIAKPITEMLTLASEKLRSRNRPSGTSGSCLLRACHRTNRTRSPRPATIIAQMAVDQWYWWPSWIPNTSRNMPAPLSATPSQSNEWVWVSSVGTRRAARNRPKMPTGTLMKKIHSQPNASTRTPPRIGPTSVATPAVAPHSAIALPRRAAGKMRVMIAIVCGVIIEAPRPWTTRATISSSTVLVSPHHREARVKTVSPVM